MSSHEFVFVLTVTAGVSPTMLRDLVSRVCTVACCSDSGTDELASMVEETVSQAASDGECQLQFRAGDGALDVVVSSGARQIWHTSRPTD